MAHKERCKGMKTVFSSFPMALTICQRSPTTKFVCVFSAYQVLFTCTVTAGAPIRSTSGGMPPTSKKAIWFSVDPSHSFKTKLAVALDVSSEQCLPWRRCTNRGRPCALVTAAWLALCFSVTRRLSVWRAFNKRCSSSLSSWETSAGIAFASARRS